MRPSDFPELPAFLFLDQPFADQALCREVGGDLFFPDKGGISKTAKRVCAACPVTAHCLEWATVTGQRFGVWGGLTRGERDAVERAREVAA